MRAKSLSIMMCFSVLVLFGVQLLSPVSQAFTLTAEVNIDIDPDTINLNRNSRWITAYIELPEGYNVSDIDPSTVSLETVCADKSDIQGNVLMVKFDAFDVINLLWDELYHMGVNRASIEVTITGQLKDGITQFQGKDTLTIMNPFQH